RVSQSPETCPCSLLCERRHGNVGTVIIHNAIKDTSTSNYPQWHQESLPVNIAAKVQLLEADFLPAVQRLQLENQSH
ncbi:hypothetical protein L211DRAFT_840771, partial [Terfezia boudieri ATCC MYA-4762]